MAGIFNRKQAGPEWMLPYQYGARHSARIASQKPEESVSGKYFDPLRLVKLLPKSCNKVCNLGTERGVVTR